MINRGHLTVTRAYNQLLNDLLIQGETIAPRGQPGREIRGYRVELPYPRANVVTCPVRAINPHFLAAEFTWMFLGRRDVASIAAYNKNIAAFSDDGETFFGAYGPRIVEQLPRVIELLKKDPDTRQAVISIFKSDATAVVT